MPSFRTVINRQELYQLEHALFALAEYVDTVEFKQDLNSQKQFKILKEIGFLEIAIGIIRCTFAGSNQEIPVVGWLKEDPNEEHGYFKVHYFSCMKVAALCTGTSTSKVSAVCNGRRKTSNGWVFKLRSEYEENDKPIEWSLDTPAFEIVNF